MFNSGIKATGKLNITIIDKFGNVKDSREINNLVVGTGLSFIVSRMKNATSTVMSHLAIGSSGTSAANNDTTLGAETARDALLSTTVSDTTITYSAQIAAGDGTGSVKEAGIFNASSDGAMLCRTTFTEVTKGVNDILAFSWTITLSAS